MDCPVQSVVASSDLTKLGCWNKTLHPTHIFLKKHEVPLEPLLMLQEFQKLSHRLSQMCNGAFILISDRHPVGSDHVIGISSYW